MSKLSLFIFSSFFLLSCSTPPKMSMTQKSVDPGGSVLWANKPLALNKPAQEVGLGERLPKSQMAGSWFRAKELSTKGQVTIINVVPSIDTPVCEEQTHQLSESPSIHSSIKRVTISMDLPPAQDRVAKEAKLTNIEYFSDFPKKDFGKKMGLIMNDLGLLARALIVTDKEGIIRHIQITPKAGELPDMEKAISVANQLVTQ